MRSFSLLRQKLGTTALSGKYSFSTLANSCTTTPRHIKIVEVSPRDGLQNIPTFVPTADKISLISQLTSAGCPSIEVTSFVSPKWIPQMADAVDIMTHLSFSRNSRSTSCRYAVLIPNLKGMERAVSHHPDEIAVFASASESFSRENINCSIDDSFRRFAPVFRMAKDAGIPVRGYVSCVMGCPYQGDVSVGAVAAVAGRLVDMGCHEVSLGDTIGVGTVGEVKGLIRAVTQFVDVEMMAVHFHDTYGQALANIYGAVEEGVSVVDASVAGIGGCPYAGGASGNVATEDVLYMLHGMGMTTGIDLDKMIDAGNFISNVLGQPTNSRVAAAIIAKRERL